jgi:polysaccharide pyruvyl transferase WcaK-like protein
MAWVLRVMGFRSLSDKVSPLRRNSNQVLIDVSGESFNDGKTFVLPYKMLSVGIGWLSALPVYKLPQVMGPFSQPLNKFSAKFCLSLCTRIYARGAWTRKHLAELGLPSEVVAEAPDVGFLYSEGYRLNDENSEHALRSLEKVKRLKLKGGRLAAIIPSAVMLGLGRERYLSQCERIIIDLIEHAYSITFIPSALRENTRETHNNDRLLIERLKSIAESHGGEVLGITFSCPTHRIRSLISEVDLICTSRFHGMINALSLGKAPFVLGWGHKYIEVLEEFGLESLYCGLGDEISSIKSRLETLISSQGSYDLQVRARLPFVIQQTVRVFDEVARDLLKLG